MMQILKNLISLIRWGKAGDERMMQKWASHDGEVPVAMVIEKDWVVMTWKLYVTETYDENYCLNIVASFPFIDRSVMCYESEAEESTVRELMDNHDYRILQVA
jgi:hypothetical protein